MTLFSIRTAVAVCLAASLAACGGGDKATFVVGGSTVGLAYSGLKLKSGDQILAVEPLVVSGVTQPVAPYAFPKSIEYGTTYTVDIAELPAKQACAVREFGEDGKKIDSAGHTATINVIVDCVTKSYEFGGKVTGLTGAGLVLINGSLVAPLPVAAGAGSFTFNDLVFVDQSYGVSVLTQPAGQTCTVLDGIGVMPNNALTATSANPITVSCVDNKAG